MGTGEPLGPACSSRRDAAGRRASRLPRTILALLLLAACSHGPGAPSARPLRPVAPGAPVATSMPRPMAGSAGPAGHLGAAPRRASGSERWRVLDPSSQAIEGYTTVSSGVPGTVVGLRVSTARHRFRVRAFRIGAYRGGTGRVVWRSALVRGHQQPGPSYASYDLRTVVARWRTSVSIPTAGWPPGFYVLRLETSGAATQVPYVVTSASTAGTVALMVPTATWQAYNVWGGYSLYAGPAGERHAYAVSFDRPYEGVNGMNDFRTALVPVVVEAERTGVALSYVTDVDLAERDGILDGATGLVSMAHAEYWTPAMRQAVLRARDAGTNLAFLGANTAYWRIRLSARQGRPARMETGYRDAAWLDPVRGRTDTTARFRDPPHRLPENVMVGMLYECFPVDADYHIVTPRWWGFTGTGVRRGSVVPDLIGGETDRVYPDRRTPRPLQILSDTAYACRGVPTTSQAVYYTVPSGAGVFASGTLRWGCALADVCDRPIHRRTTRFVRRVTDNLLQAFAAGPVGRRHRARDNVAQFHLPLANTVPAS